MTTLKEELKTMSMAEMAELYLESKLEKKYADALVISLELSVRWANKAAEDAELAADALRDKLAKVN